MDREDSRQSNYTHVLAELRPGEARAVVYQVSATILLYFEGGEMNCCVWRELTWRASLDMAVKNVKWQSRGLYHDAALIKLAELAE